MTDSERKPSDGTGNPLRVAFVGQSVYFRQCALESPTDGLEPAFFDFRSASAPEPLLARLRAHDPDVVVVFRPEIIPPSLFCSLRAHTIGYLTEPLPRTGGVDHHDLRARLAWLREVDASNFDRIVSFDPLIEQTAQSVLDVWRSLPIPVADSLFMDVRPRSQPPKLLFVGRSTEHRETLLAPIKRTQPIVHIAHGLYGETLKRFLRRADVQLNLHNHPYPTFENRVCVALAAGHLVISETLSPSHALQPGVDHLEANTPEELLELVEHIACQPRVFEDVQRAGREQAERFRASLVYPQLVREAIRDIEERGSGRQRD
jgi:hypothetical protein